MEIYLCLLLIADKTPTGETGLAGLDYKSHYDYEEGRGGEQADLNYLVIKETLPTVGVTVLNGSVFFSCQIPQDLLGRHER